MKTNFLKVRMPAESYSQLKTRAAEAGKPISTFANELLQQEKSLAQTSMQLEKIEAQLQELAVLAATAESQSINNLNLEIREILLIVRELALDRNAQILSRVSTQIKLI